MKQFFTDDTGALSCMRLMCFAVTFTVLALWAWGCFAAGHYIPIGYDMAGLISACHGCKGWQSRVEYGYPAMGAGMGAGGNSL